MSEIVFEKCTEFVVFDEVLKCFPNEEKSLVIEMDNVYYHLGEKECNLQTILEFLEKHNNSKFSEEEIEMIIEENEVYDGQK